MMKAKDALTGEWIGRDVEVVEARNASCLGLRGKVVDETRNMLIIEAQDGTVKRLVKSQVTIKARLGRGWVRVDGRALVGRPEDRLKSKVKW